MSLPSLLDTSTRYKRDIDTQYASNRFEFLEAKSAAKKSGVPVAAYVASVYITALFDILPNDVSYLKVGVPYVTPSIEGTFNSFGAVPIVVHRNDSSPSQISTLLRDCFYFSYVIEQFIRGKAIPLWIKNVITDLSFKPDVIFSSMLHDGYDMNSSIHSPSTATVFYANYCDNVISTSCPYAYDISKIASSV